MSEEIPLGVRHNNYLNVKNDSADPWQDAGGRPAGTDAVGHAVFGDPAYGVRAGIITLRSYFFTHKLRTLTGIMARWAPAGDTLGSRPGRPRNSPLAYARFVAAKMGVSVDERLGLFNPDRSVGDEKQLRALFYAMAENEVGAGFKVPDDVFDAGLALVRDETVAAAGAVGGGPAGPAGVELPPAVETPHDADDGAVPKWELGGSVGRWDEGAVNAEADVRVVQMMLRLAAMDMKDSRVDPGDIDGEIAEAVEDSDTVAAINAFQSRFLGEPDGLIEVGRRTWRELLGVVEGESRLEEMPPPETEAGEGPRRFFPFTRLPKNDWTKPYASFGSRRDEGRRAHAACDLYFPMNTTIHAIADGKVVRGPYYFYSKTWALDVDHGDFLVRYGEVKSSTFVREGDRVRAGQPIAKVGRLNMLHFELYSNRRSDGRNMTGDLTNLNRAASLKDKNGRPYLRRHDLLNPTALLNELKHNLPGRSVAPKEVSAVSSSAAASAAAARIPAAGFCLHLKRTRQERRPSMNYPRTVGEYQCYWNGEPIADLRGQMVERGGPGDNTTAVGDERDLRINAGAYRLAIHKGTRYKTHGYREHEPSFENLPNPGLLLLDTRERTYILIHPGEDYVKSIGCLNPTDGLTDASSPIAFAESRARVIAIIEALKTRLGTKFPAAGAIPNATVVIEGEPV